MTDNVVLSSALKVTLHSLRNAERSIGVVTARLASGLKVNSALDDPKNFFTSLSLREVAGDYSKLLDGIGQSIRTIEEALIGLDTVEQLIDQGEAIATKSKKLLEAGIVDSGIMPTEINSSPPSLSSQILQSMPDVYYRLNETAGPIVDYGFGGAGPVAASYTGGAAAGAAPLYTNGPAPSVNFDGVNDRISVSDSTMINTSTTPARTVELVFNADDVSGRQVLYEEGATVNGMTIYIDNGLIRVTAEDDQGANRFADLDISAPIIAGQTYHIALVFDGAAQTFAGYLDGVDIGTLNITSDAVFPSHSGDVGIGGVSGGVQFHDGEDGTASGYNFDGRISDVAIHNRALGGPELLAHAESLNSSTTTLYFHHDYENVINQIDKTVLDARYRGVSLLNDDDLRTNFNPERSSFLITEGEDLTVNGLGLERYDFNDESDLEDIIESLREARLKVREFARTLVGDLSILQTRDDYTRDKVVTHIGGSGDLITADMNKEGANLLASQTRQELAVTSLSLAAQSASAVLRLF